MSPVVKLMRPAEWESFRRDGVFHGSADDVRDGFIHLSAPEQVRGTAAKWFADADTLVVLTIDTAPLGDALRWEPSGRGMFPHLYAPLALSAVARVDEVTRGPDGAYVFPDDMP